jgi:ribosomal protein S18 acetylase RimI-like enzyme
MDDWWTILRSGLWRLYYKLSREGRARFYREFLPLLHNTKQEVLGARDENSFYLVYIGTKPKARGKGYARLLIEHGTRMVSLFLSHLPPVCLFF